MDQSSKPRRRRGRPREVEERTPGTGTAIGRRPADLPPTTRAIIDAARTVLLRDGAHAFSLVAVAKQAHVDVTTIPYHFGTKHGLIEGVLDMLYAEPAAALQARLRALPDAKQRYRAFFSAVRSMYADPSATQLYFELTVLAFRDDALRARLGQLSTWVLREYMRAVNLDGDDPIGAELIASAIDGVELRRALVGTAYPTDAVLDLLEELMVARAGRAGSLPSADGHDHQGE